MDAESGTRFVKDRGSLKKGVYLLVKVMLHLHYTNQVGGVACLINICII